MRDEAGAGDALNQRTRRRDRVQLGAQCVRAQPANAVEARAPAAMRVQRQATRTLQLVQAIPSANVRADAIESEDEDDDL